MTLYFCPWCEEVDYEESEDEEDDDEVEFDICADCILEFGLYFIMDGVEIFEFLREIDITSEFCEEN